MTKFRRPAHWCALLVFASLAACSTLPAAAPIPDSADTRKPVTVYVARRNWHTDVGFAATDLDPALAPVRAQFATAGYLFFGFGDQHYLMTRDKNAPLMLRALWPGPALVLVTALENTPAQAFGPSQVISIELSAAQAHAMETFIRDSITGSDITPVAPGPYEGSAFYPAPQRYSALHTCNTWVAEALKAGGLPVRSKGVVFAGQLWSQAARLGRQGVPAPESR
jgi:uncharacterized protein (TIGR02117 family)